MADGGKALTREQRLLSWANEVEAQMVGARQELRRARMELAAVQEDARKAREESKKLYARLAESEAARVAAASNLRAAVTANEVSVFFCMERSVRLGGDVGWPCVGDGTAILQYKGKGERMAAAVWLACNFPLNPNPPPPLPGADGTAERSEHIFQIGA